MRDPVWWLRAIRVVGVFSFVSIGWLFFKLQDFSHAWLFLSTLMSSETPGVDKKLALLIGTYSVAVFFYHAASLYRESIPRQVKDVAYGAMLFFIVTSGGPVNPFIYFQF
jgi:alginate O-acetyltransferase complex protein AlgI